jgi:hypothetical protein
MEVIACKPLLWNLTNIGPTNLWIYIEILRRPVDDIHQIYIVEY